MALVRRILRVLLKRLHITLAVAQRIARFLQSTFHHIRSMREFWNVTEVLIRSLIPEVRENINGTVGEDELSEARDRNNQQGTVEGDSETENDASDTILTSDEEEVNLMVLVEDSTTNSGECSNVHSILGTVDVEFADEELKSSQATTEEEMENNASHDTILTPDDKEKVLVADSTTNSGECLSVYSISDTVNVEEVFADEGLKSKVCTVYSMLN